MYIKSDLKRGSYPGNLTSLHNMFPKKQCFQRYKKRKMSYKHFLEYSVFLVSTVLKNTHKAKLKM